MIDLSKIKIGRALDWDTLRLPPSVLEFPSGPTFSTRFELTWKESWFDQFEDWATPWRMGVFGFLDGAFGALWLSGVMYSGSIATTQPRIVITPGEGFDDGTDYVLAVDALPFLASDADGVIYHCDHAALVQTHAVEGGGMTPAHFHFASFAANTTV